MRFYATTNPGLEDVALREVLGLGAWEGYTLPGVVVFTADERMIYRANILSRTLHKVVLMLLEAEVRSLRDIYGAASAVDYAEYIGRRQSFAVRAERIGEHPFTSIDVAATVGQAVIDSFRGRTGVRLRVDLSRPDVEVFARLREERLLLGINTTGESLHKRGYRVYSHPAALKTTIAAAMLILSGWRPGEPLLDPMCGGGTIPIEAALMARNIPPGLYRESHAFRKLVIYDPELHAREVESALSRMVKDVYPISGLEIYQKHLGGALLNAYSAGVIDTVDIRWGDATRLSKYVQSCPRHVVVNPPYGRRSSTIRAVKRLYRRFLRSAGRLGCGLRITAITAAPNIFKSAMAENGFTVTEDRVAKHGAIYTHIIVGEKNPSRS